MWTILGIYAPLVAGFKFKFYWNAAVMLLGLWEIKKFHKEILFIYLKVMNSNFFVKNLI